MKHTITELMQKWRMLVNTDKTQIVHFRLKKVHGNSLADGNSRALGKLLSNYYSNKGLAINTYMKLVSAL